jgi:hypothetical protein
MSAPQSTSQSKYTIFFHGNCIDGWFSCFIAHSFLAPLGRVRQYPIAPGQPSTWKMAEPIIPGTHILLLDVSVSQEVRDGWMANGALSINCIDHHASAEEHWPAGQSPIHTESCAAIQTWQRFYPQYAVPAWLQHIDRVDRWDNPTEEDRCIREVLNIIAHKPVQRKFTEAFTETQAFIQTMQTPEGVAATVAKGREILQQKDSELHKILANGVITQITPDVQAQWQLPESWANITVFVIDNTNIVFDSTEAAHQVFTYYPQCVAFINYRKKTFLERGDMAVEKTAYTYSARSRGFNLTDGSIFRGHPTSAGANLIQGEAPFLPFLLVSSSA